MNYAVALLFLVSGPAHALTCDQVLAMVEVETPIGVILDTVASSAERFPRTELRCLRRGKAPLEVLTAARAARGNPALAASALESELPQPAAGSALRQAVDLRTAGDHHAASIVLARLPAEPRVQYELGRALRGLGLYHSALFYFIEALKAGPSDPSFASALTQVVSLSDVIDDRSDLGYIVRRVPPEAFPLSVRDELSYQLGLYRYELDALAEAVEHFERVPKRSPRYWHATFMLGVIHSRQGTVTSGVRAFTEVTGEAPDRDLRDLARLNLANLHYSARRFEEAAMHFDLPADSPRYIESRLRLGWARFMLRQPIAMALDPIPDGAWFPEAALLRGLEAFETGRYLDAVANMDAFETTHAPIKLQLNAILNKYSTEHGLLVPDDAFRRYGDPTTSPLPPALLKYVFQDRAFGRLVAHLALMDAEERLVQRQPEAWREVFTERLARVIGDDRLRFQRRAGLTMLHDIAHATLYLGDLLRQARILRFESADAAERIARSEGRPFTDRSTALLREVVASTPKGPTRADALVRLAARVDDAEAITICEGLLAAAPPSWDPSSAAYLLALADPARTLTLMSRIVMEWPSSTHAPAAWLVLGDDHLTHGRFAEARAAYERVATLPKNGHYAYANYKLGWTLHALGDHATGQEKLGVAIESTTDDTLRAHASSERERLARL